MHATPVSTKIARAAPAGAKIIGPLVTIQGGDCGGVGGGVGGGRGGAGGGEGLGVSQMHVPM